ncbi:MAG: tetratricopeptide repeat protein, partial [Bacteroidota bacterium]
MKKLTFLISYLLVFASLPAQTLQKGKAREINSGKSPLSGVFVKFEDTPSTNSDQNGNFTLSFVGKKPGELIFLEEIRKKNYELVNKKDFEISKISDNDSLGVDIILAKAGYVDAAKKEYYEVSDKALYASFEREKKRLKKKLEEAEFDQEKYLRENEKLQEAYNIQKANLDHLSERFAQVNFDDVEPLYEEALKLFKAGEIDSCLTLLEGADLITKSRKERKRKGLLQKEIDRINENLKKAIGPLQLQAQLYALRFENKKAEKLYDELILLDSTSLDILQEVADFYREQHRYAKAQKLYPKIIDHEATQPWQLANAYGHIGELETNTGDIKTALKIYNTLFSKYDSLVRKYPRYPFYKHNLAVSYSKLGSTHTSLGNLDSALLFYKQDLILTEQLYKAYPANVEFKNGLAISYQFLGNTHTSLGNLDSALLFYKQDLILTE